MLGELPVAALHLGIVEGGVDDGGPQIIEHDAARNAAEELEGGAVQAQPCRDRLVEDEFGVLMAAARQDHHEHPGAAHPAQLGIEERAGVAEVDLRFLPRGDLHPNAGARGRRGLAPQEALHRGVDTMEGPACRIA